MAENCAGCEGAVTTAVRTEAGWLCLCWRCHLRLMERSWARHHPNVQQVLLAELQEQMARLDQREGQQDEQRRDDAEDHESKRPVARGAR